MGAKASTIWYVDAPDPLAVLRESAECDAEAARALVGALYPETVVAPLTPGAIATSAGVGRHEVYIGSFPGLTVVCGANLAVHEPSTLDESWTRPLASERTYLVCTDPDTAWASFACWERGALRRSFSATPVHIYEDIGIPLVWERPFWAGEHPMKHPIEVLPDPQSLPFNPCEFAEAANAEWLGFRYTGPVRDGEIDPATVGVCGFGVYAEGELPPAPALEPKPAGSLRRWLRRLAGAEPA
ncbi:hypothetical protein FK531_05895 [Rhodococcus spelaei]|uniref:Uncharacterized protein n=1 Tax=Rhodococcus spelaei TaxID=2546320 RepID=A0A541BPC5_9NOCA|nr:hypothetical protein [Rhodococcus spelaei]TQF74176.1 hypothetical protein FK531_05895 [Rhodococcus spelaei]